MSQVGIRSDRYSSLPVFIDVRDYASFSAAVDAIGSTEATLIIPNEQAVAVDKTVPLNITLQFTEGGSLNIATTKTVIINGHIEAGLYQIFKWTGTGKVVFGGGTVKEIYPEWWGAYSDGTHPTETTAAINAALASPLKYTGYPNDLGLIGGVKVKLSGGSYAVNSSLIIGSQDVQTFEYALEGGGQWNTIIAWVGGNNDDIIDIGRPSATPMINFSLKKIALFNRAISGSGPTAVRSTNINGIRLCPPPAIGLNNLLFEEVHFWYLDNGIIQTSAGGVNALTLRKCLFNALYNQTDPVVDPLTDALVLGHGNGIYFGDGSIMGLEIYDCTWMIQGYLLDCQTTNLGNFIMMGNENEGSSFIYNKAIRLKVFTSINIMGNWYTFPAGGAANIVFDLGTAALGSSDLSGGVISGNFIIGSNSVGQDGVRLTYADGVSIFGNTFHNMAGKGINLVGANVKNTFIGQNFWKTVTTKLYDGGSLNTTILDQVISAAIVAPILGAKMTLAGEIRGRKASSGPGWALDAVLLTGLDALWGIVVIGELADGAAAIYRSDYRTLTAISANALFSTTKDTAGKYNVYWETDQFKIQNKVANGKDIAITFYGI